MHRISGAIQLYDNNIGHSLILIWLLPARGIEMTVEEVVELPTCKYADRVHSLKLSEDDLAFLKGLRRRIKNRVSMSHELNL